MPGKLRDPVQIALRHVAHVLGMDADGGVDVGKALRQADRGLAGAKLAAGIDDKAHARFGQCRQHRLPVGVKSPAVVMRVGVKIHNYTPFRNLYYMARPSFASILLDASGAPV